jgi:hypothetical protein
MWPRDFDKRLAAWAELRAKCQSATADEAIQMINSWWFAAPWRNYHLHWDDQLTWPDPWQLLNDDIYCELARGLGMLYTISMIDHKDLASSQLVLTEEGYNLVLVNQGKYILNWDVDMTVNTPLPTGIKKRFTQEQANQLFQ